MKLNQNVLSPHNNFNKVDIAQITVNVVDSTQSVQQYTAEFLLDNYLRYSVLPTTDYEKQLQYLDRKIEATRKTISS